MTVGRTQGGHSGAAVIASLDRVTVFRSKGTLLCDTYRNSS